MALPLLIETELDERSASEAASRIERTFSDAARDVSRTVSDQMGGAFRAAGQDVDRMADTARTAFRRMADASDDVTTAERDLADVRDRGGQAAESAARQAVQARGREERAIREAAGALDEYERAARGAGDAGESAGNSIRDSFNGLGAAARGAGTDAADEFGNGFAGGAGIARIAGAGATAVAGIAALGFMGGKLLAENIAAGMESLATKDVFQARLQLDDDSMRNLGSGAGKAFAAGYGESVAANMSTAQFGIQANLITPDDSAEMQHYIEQTQTLANLMAEDPSAVARGARNMVSTGMVDSYQQAYDLLQATNAQGLNISEDLLDTMEEYGTAFRAVGLDGADALGLINQMWEGGARNVDVAADGLKEFSITVVDNAQTTRAAFSAMGFDADEMTRKFSEGGPAARQAMGEVISAITSIEDPIERNQVGLALFKTKWEDMRDAVLNANLDTAATGLGNINGALDRGKDKVNENVNQWDLLGRNIDAAVTKLDEWLARTAGPAFNFVPKLINDIVDQNDPNRQIIPGPASTPPGVPFSPGMLIPGAPGAPSSTTGPGGLLTPSLDGPPPPAGTPGAGAGAASVRGASSPYADALQREKDAAAAPGGSAAKPSFDPSQYSVGAIPVIGDPRSLVTPLAPGAPGASLQVDPQKVFDAQTAEQNARASVESARIKVLELEADDTATAQSIAAAKNSVQQSERAYLSSQAKLIEAQQGTWAKANAAISGAMGDLNDIFAPLADDFGISGGLPGIAENLVKIFGNLALGSAIGSNPAWQASILADMATPSAGAAPGAPGTSASYAGSVATAAVGGQYGLPAGTDTGGYGSGGKGIFPDWVQQLGAKFGVTPSTYSGHQESDRNEAGYAPNPNHENRGIDWTGSPQAMQQFADYLKTVPGMEQVIWNGAGQGTGDTVEVAGGRSQPGYFADDLGGHGNHVHTRQSGAIPVPGSPLGSSASSGPVPVNVVNAGDMGGLSAEQWNSIAGAEASGNWATNTGNGFSGGLQFSPSTWNAFGGGQYAPEAWQATPQQQMAVGNATLAGQGPGAWPATSAAHPEWFVPGAMTPGLPAGGMGGGGMGSGFPQTPQFPGSPAYQGFAAGSASVPLGGAAAGGGTQIGAAVEPAVGTGSGGIGISGDGLIGAAASMFPGGGVAAKLASRAIQFGGQAVGIGIQGAMETFLPTGGSELAQGGWAGKIIGGLAGAKPAKPNTAGNKPPTAQPGQGGPGGQGGPTDKSVNITNNVTNQRATEDGTARDLETHQMASWPGAGPGNR